MKWLITGGAGFIGTNLALDLVKHGHACVVTDNFHRPGARLNRAFLAERHRIHVLNLDVRFPDRVDAFFAAQNGFDAIAHLAGQVSLVASIDDPRYDFDANALGSFNVLEAVRRLSPEARVIYASTNKVYGDLQSIRFEETDTRYTAPDYPSGFPESLPIELHGGYSCSKGCADQYVRDYHRIYGLKTVALRQSSIYGGHQFATEDQGWVAYFVRMGVENRRFRISGTGKQVRDLLHISDLCSCFRTIAELPAESAAWGEAFNIGGGFSSSLSLIELFEILRSRYGFAIEYDAGPPRTGDQKVFVADTSKAADLLGWKRETCLDCGLDEMVSWSRLQWSAF